MQVTEEFVEFYNEIFKFIDERLGYSAIRDFWKRISPILLADLKKEVEENGLQGCVNYWEEILRAEGTRYHITLDDKFTLEIEHCPTWNSLEEPYEFYCEHCKVMYEPIFEKLGYKYNISGGEGSCRITVSK